MADTANQQVVMDTASMEVTAEVVVNPRITHMGTTTPGWRVVHHPGGEGEDGDNLFVVTYSIVNIDCILSTIWRNNIYSDVQILG